MASTSGNSTHVPSIADESDSNFWSKLDELPDEILLKIVEFLPPTSYLLLENGNERIKRIALSARIGNFSLCSYVTTNEVQGIINPRCFYLKELYLDNLVYIKSSLLVKLISKCKNLHTLSAKNCGLHMKQLFSAIGMLELEELSFTILSSTDIIAKDKLCDLVEKSLPSIPKSVSSLKKIHLDVQHNLSFCAFCLTTLGHTTKLAEFSVSFSSVGIFDEADRLCAQATSYPNLTKLTSLVVVWPLNTSLKVDVEKAWKKHYLLPLFKWMFAKEPSTRYWKKLWISEVPCADDVYRACKVDVHRLSSASHLFLTEETPNRYDIHILQKFLPRSVSHLGLYVPEVEERHVSDICHAGGKALKKLSLVSNYEKAILMNIDYFSDITCKCTNIIDLDITGTHVDDYRNTLCSAISLLKTLHRLCLPLCAITDSPQSDAPVAKDDERLFASPTARKRQCLDRLSYRNATEIFSRMVESCPLVEEFCLTGCSACDKVGKNEEFCGSTIQKACLWSNLKHVIIENVKTTRLHTFISSIAQKCLVLKSLHMKNVGQKSNFTYLQSVISFLEYCKNLEFLSVDHSLFGIFNDRFWDAVANSKQLRGLCLRGSSDQPIPNKINKILSQLDYFHVLHLDGRSRHSQTTNWVEDFRDKMPASYRNKKEKDVILCDLVTNYFLPDGNCSSSHCGIRALSVKCATLK